MPGSSLWLTPPTGELNTNIQISIIADIPSFFLPDRSINFIPHITLTSFIPASIINPETSNPAEIQQWLDALDLPDDLAKINIRGDQTRVGDIFFQRLTMPCCDKSESLQSLARACRAQATLDTLLEAETWAREAYYPHMSLMYSERSPEEVAAKLDEIKAEMRERRSKYPSSRTAKGGQIVLVPTDLPVGRWEPIATRELPELEWEWEV